MQTKDALPGFWIFMYRVSPFTYWVAGMAGTLLHGREVVCSSTEMSVLNPPAGQTCGEFFAAYLTQAPGQLQNPQATSGCQYCSLSTSDQFLTGTDIYYSQRWMNFGIFFAYIGFNLFAATALYYVFRVANLKSFTLKKKSAGKVAHGAKAAIGKPGDPEPTDGGAEAGEGRVPEVKRAGF